MKGEGTNGYLLLWDSSSLAYLDTGPLLISMHLLTQATIETGLNQFVTGSSEISNIITRLILTKQSQRKSS
jgi:hypothetical protein